MRRRAGLARRSRFFFVLLGGSLELVRLFSADLSGMRGVEVRARVVLVRSGVDSWRRARRSQQNESFFFFWLVIPCCSRTSYEFIQRLNFDFNFLPFFFTPSLLLLHGSSCSSWNIMAATLAALSPCKMSGRDLVFICCSKCYSLCMVSLVLLHDWHLSFSSSELSVASLVPHDLTLWL